MHLHGNPVYMRLSRSATLLLTLVALPFRLLFAQEEVSSVKNPVLESAVEEYREALNELEGGYNAGSIEINLDLATALDGLERFDEAAAVYEQALQTMRIRDGLYGATQLPLLERAIDSAFLDRNWELVDRNFYVALSILEHSVPATDPRYEDWVRWFSSWKIAAHRNEVELSDGSLALQDVTDYYEDLQNSLSDDDPAYKDKLIAYNREKTLAHYFTAIEISTMPFDEFASAAPETVTGQRCYVVIRNGQPTTICNNTQVPNPDFFESRQQTKSDALQLQISQVLDGYQQLIATLEADPGTKPEDLAVAELELGDMNLMLRNMPAARAHYARAHKILTDAGLAETVGENLMGSPQDIIGNVLLASPKPVELQAKSPSGFVSFDVTEDGEVQNLGIIGESADLEEANQELIADRLRRSVYRPRLESGIPVTSRLKHIPAVDL